MKNNQTAVLGLALGLFFGLSSEVKSQMVAEGDSIWRIENFDWIEKPEMETRPNITKLDEALLDHRYYLEYRYEGNTSVMYELIHRRVWVGSEKAVEDYNKIYIAVGDDEESIRTQARVLQPNGKVTVLKEKDIQSGKDDNDNELKYFALEGVQPGSVVEYLVLSKQDPNYMGSRITLQRTIPVFNLDFQLVTQGNLIFGVKSYNALNEVERDTVLQYQNRYFIQQDSMPEFKAQSHAYNQSNRGYVLFFLDRNLATGKRDINSFAYASANIYNNIHVPVSKKASKALKKLVNTTGAKKEEDPVRAILAIEEYLKRNFFIINAGNEDLYDLEKILSNKMMNKTGALRLYHHAYLAAGFENELVFTSDKSAYIFDPKMENHLFLRESMLYFPEQDIFLDPTDLLSRLQYFDIDMRGTLGLFVSGVELAGMVEGIGEVKEISPGLREESTSLLEVDWKLSPDGIGRISVRKESTGYNAKTFQSIAHLVDDDKMEEFRKGTIEYMYSEVELEDLVIENLESKHFPFDPLIVSASFDDELFTEPGSSSTIIKIGDIIGPQSELYKTDSVRVLPVKIGYPRTYKHIITLHIPEGYVLKNLESLKIVETTEEEVPVMQFISDYTLDGNKLVIEINEWYTYSEYPVEQFEDYRRIINAAADFNKRYLIMEKAQ